MNKTLYLRDEEGPIWDKARTLTGDKLSGFIMEKLRAFITEHEGEEQGHERIVLRYIDQGIPRAKAFMGRWLITPDEPWVDEFDISPFAPKSYAVAVTPKSNVVVFRFGEQPHNGEFGPSVFQVFGSFEDANRNTPGSLITEAMRRQGVQIQELDI